MAHNTDIYAISQEISDLQRKYVDEDDDILSVGMYGYMADQFATMTQNAIMMASEWGNEAFVTRARFEKTILSNAISFNINNINARPSQMDIQIGVVRSALDAVMDKLGRDRYVISRNTVFKIAPLGLIYRLEYDLTIIRKRKSNGKFVYYGMNTYEGLEYNTGSPYLPAPILTKYSGDEYLFFNTTIKQMEVANLSRRLISNNMLDNKAIDFTFQNQLYKFTVKVKKANGEIIHIQPIFEGEAPLKVNFCNYYFTSADNIRVKFSRLSYIPSINDEILIEVYTTKGFEGNVKCDNEILFTSNDNGSTLHGVILPLEASHDGMDRKDMETLKQIIPKERHSRGILSNDKDLDNFFNVMDSNSRVKFFRKRHNQLERSFYSYLIAKDNNGNVIPTNTVDVNLRSSTFKVETDTGYVLPPNVPLVYKPNSDVCTPINEDHMENIMALEQFGFVYTSPFIININKKPLYVSYFLNVVDNDYTFNYTYINNESLTQFITSKMKVYKNHIYDNYHYYITFNIKSNVTDDLFKTTVNEDGEKEQIPKIKPVYVLYKGDFKYYIEGELVQTENITADNRRDSYRVQFKLETDNIVTHGLKVKNVYQYGTTTEVDVILPDSVKSEVLLFLEPDEDSGEPNNITAPNESYKDLVLINRLQPKTDIVLYYDYTDIMNSVATIGDSYDNVYDFTVKSVPVVKFSYIQDIDRCDTFIDYIHKRKIYTDYALELLTNNFTIDMKFFNTYGPSKAFHISRNGEFLDKVNIDISFSYRPKPGANTALVELMTDSAKMYIENINNINNLHVNNLISFLKKTYKDDVEFIEFIGINDYDGSYQYIEKLEDLPQEAVPEFININLNSQYEPSILFKLV